MNDSLGEFEVLECSYEYLGKTFARLALVEVLIERARGGPLRLFQQDAVESPEPSFLPGGMPPPQQVFNYLERRRKRSKDPDRAD